MFQGTHTHSKVHSSWSARQGVKTAPASLHQATAGTQGRHHSSCSEAPQHTPTSQAHPHSQMFTADSHMPGTELGTPETETNQPHRAKAPGWAQLRC